MPQNARMQLSPTGEQTICLFLTVALTLTFTSAHIVGCRLEKVKGHTGFFLDTNSGRIRPCAAGTIFDLQACTCVHGASNVKGCPFKVIQSDNTIYFDTITGKVRSCASGLAFSSLLCRCEKVCSARFSLDFDSTLKNKIIRYNVGGNNLPNLQKGKAKFNEHSSIIFWTFQNRPIEPVFQIQLRFKDDPNSKSKTQVLLTNCDAMDHPTAPSLLIYLDKSKTNAAKKDMVRVQMRTYNMSQGVEVAVPFISGETHVVVVLKAADSLKVRIIYQNQRDFLESNKLIGQVITSNNYLRLGSCPGDFNGFIGDLDWFDYFPCWPKV